MIKVAWFASGRLRPRVFRIKTKLYFVMLSQIQNIQKLLFRLERPKDLFLRLWKIISFNLEVNSSESWRLIWGAEALGWISLNYLLIRFISIHIIHIRWVRHIWSWAWWERGPWERIPRMSHARPAYGIKDSQDWSIPTWTSCNVRCVIWEFNEFLSYFRWILFRSLKTLDYLNNKRKRSNIITQDC